MKVIEKSLVDKKRRLNKLVMFDQQEHGNKYKKNKIKDNVFLKIT